jgi:hypothetical protein
VVDQALLKVRPAPGFSGIEHDGGNRVRVIMTLADPPLAAATYARGFAGLGAKRKLNVHTTFSRSYVSTLEAEQTRAIARVHDLVPSAIVSRRYQILVNGFAVSVPYSRLPSLVNSGIASRVYPSLSYNLDLNRGPSVVGAPQFSIRSSPRQDSRTRPASRKESPDRRRRR